MYDTLPMPISLWAAAMLWATYLIIRWFERGGLSVSRHHIAQKWTTHAPKLREKYARLLPYPCIECGAPVLKTDSWHVGHKRAAAEGGRPSIANTGPVHARCNLRSGGQLGARITNGRRNAQKDIREW